MQSRLSRYYVGIRPMVVVRDLDMLKEIMVKQFETFIDREVSLRIMIRII